MEEAREEGLPGHGGVEATLVGRAMSALVGEEGGEQGGKAGVDDDAGGGGVGGDGGWVEVLDAVGCGGGFDLHVVEVERAGERAGVGHLVDV